MKLINLIAAKLMPLILLFALFMAFGCSGKKGYLKYKANHKEVFAQDCLEAFPTKETFIQGKDSIIERTLLVKGDSVPCPQVPGVTTKTVYVKCPDAKIVYRDRFRTDTVRLEDGRLLVLNKSLTIDNAKKETENKQLKEDNAGLKLALGIVVIALLFALYRLVRR